jgi:hypothetical protein
MLREWLDSLPPSWPKKTHVWVGAELQTWNGVPLSLSQRRQALPFNDWADARVVAGGEIWIVEAKLENKPTAYGEVMWYAHQYPLSSEYQQFAPMPVIPVVLAAAEKPSVTGFFAQYGVRTITFAPWWTRSSIAQKIYGSIEDL